MIKKKISEKWTKFYVRFFEKQRKKWRNMFLFHRRKRTYFTVELFWQMTERIDGIFCSFYHWDRRECCCGCCSCSWFRKLFTKVKICCCSGNWKWKYLAVIIKANTRNRKLKWLMIKCKIKISKLNRTITKQIIIVNRLMSDGRRL